MLSKPKPQKQNTAHVTTCQDPIRIGGTTGWAALDLTWTYGPGQVPKFLNIKVIDLDATNTPDITEGGYDVPDPSSGFAKVPAFQPWGGHKCKVIFTGNVFKAANLPLGGQQDEFRKVIQPLP